MPWLCSLLRSLQCNKPFLSLRCVGTEHRGDLKFQCVGSRDDHLASLRASLTAPRLTAVLRNEFHAGLFERLSMFSNYRRRGYPILRTLKCKLL